MPPDNMQSLLIDVIATCHVSGWAEDRSGGHHRPLHASVTRRRASPPSLLQRGAHRIDAVPPCRRIVGKTGEVVSPDKHLQARAALELRRGAEPESRGNGLTWWVGIDRQAPAARTERSREEKVGGGAMRRSREREENREAMRGDRDRGGLPTQFSVDVKVRLDRHL